VTRELAVNEAPDKHTGLGCVDEVFESAPIPTALLPDRYAPSLPSRFPVNAFHTSSVIAWHSGIPHVLKSIHDPQILSPIIEGISVDVIDLIAIPVWQTQDEAMQENLFSRGVRAMGNRAKVWSGRLMSGRPPAELGDAGAVFFVDDELNFLGGFQRACRHESILSGRTQNA
jgi:hypothetical protein